MSSKGIDTITVTVNTETGVSVVFRPTEKMKAFRALATVMANKGEFFHRDWISATRNPESEFTFDPVLRKEWVGWCDIPGFRDWFYAMMPDVHDLDDMDMKFLEAEYWDQIRKGMQEGQSWAIKEFAARRFNKRDSATSESAVEMSQWISSGKSDAWGSGPAEA